ncbi:MAG: MTH938/NDUFAF3 family protein [Pseudomonadota bacterium]
MQFSKETPVANSISQYDAHSVTIRGVNHRGSLAVADQTLLADWHCEHVDALRESHLHALLSMKPEVIVLATGSAPVFPDGALMRQVMHAGVGIEIMNDGAAVRTFNVLISEARRAVLALIRPTA